MIKAIIIGAASGMGKQAARLLVERGYSVGIADNQQELLQAFAEELPATVVTKRIDVIHHLQAREQLTEMIHQLGGLDLFIYCAGIKDKSGIWENEYNLHQVNAIGFAALAHVAFNYYRSNNIKGQIVGISSLLAMRGFYFAIPYCASKAFMRGYMQGLRHESAQHRLGITITDIRPGFVSTNMLKNERQVFWVSHIEKAANQIVNAIDKKKKWAYITRRWELVGLICKYMPDVVLNNLRLRTISSASQVAK